MHILLCDFMGGLRPLQAPAWVSPIDGPRLCCPKATDCAAPACAHLCSGRPIDALSPAELAVLGMVLVNSVEAAAAGPQDVAGPGRALPPAAPPAFTKAYISCVKKRWVDRLRTPRPASHARRKGGWTAGGCITGVLCCNEEGVHYARCVMLVGLCRRAGGVVSQC